MRSRTPSSTFAPILSLGSSSRSFSDGRTALFEIAEPHLQIGVAFQREEIEPRQHVVVAAEVRIIRRDVAANPAEDRSRAPPSRDSVSAISSASREPALVEIEPVEADQNGGVIGRQRLRRAQMLLGHRVVLIGQPGLIKILLGLRRQSRPEQRIGEERFVSRQHILLAAFDSQRHGFP